MNSSPNVQSAASVNQSMFKAETNRKVLVEVEWNGPLQTSTREYTRIRLIHGADCIANLLINNENKFRVDRKVHLGGSNPVSITASELRVTVCIDYLKCSGQDIWYVRGADGKYRHSPRYIGEGKYQFNIKTSKLNQAADTQICRLIITNNTIGNKVDIEAELKPGGGAADESFTNTLNPQKL